MSKTSRTLIDYGKKAYIIDLIKQRLYGLCLDNLSKQLLDIVIANDKLAPDNKIPWNIGSSTFSKFSYKGVTYPDDVEFTNSILLKCFKKIPLNESLYPVMDKYIKAANAINVNEIPYVMGYIRQVLNSSDILEDYLQLLPENFHDILKRNVSCTSGFNLTDATGVHYTRHTDESIKLLLEVNQNNIQRIKNRLLTNLITQ